MELSEAVVHVGGLKCVDSIIVKLRFAQIGETPRAVLGDSGECRMWELVANLVSFSFSSAPDEAHCAHRQSRLFFFILPLALSTMGTPLEDEYPTSFRDFLILFVSF